MSGYDYAKFCQAVAALHGHDCYVRWVVSRRPLAVPSNWEHCTGGLDGHHLVPKRMLKREFPGGALIEDGKLVAPRSGSVVYRSGPLSALSSDGSVAELDARTLDDLLNDGRNGIPTCRHHHDLLENRIIKLLRSELPRQVEEFAAELGLGWFLDREFGTC